MNLESINLQQKRQKCTMEKQLSLNKWSWENWTATSKNMKSESFLISDIKINSKWIKELNVRP